MFNLRFDCNNNVCERDLSLTADEYNNSGMKKHDSHSTGSATLQEENKISPDRNHKRGHRSSPNDKACNIYMFSCYFLCCDRYSD